MAKTVDQILANHEEHAARCEMGLNSARSRGDYHLAAFNCRQAFESRLLQGLITWRTGGNPTTFLVRAVRQFGDDWQIVQELGAGSARLSDVAFEHVQFIAYLIGITLPFEIEPGAAASLESDRLLDAVLSQWLFGSWDAPLWERGLEQLRNLDSQLAVETYVLYRRVTRATLSEGPELTEEAEALFTRRREDEFFSGGQQTDGGGPDNDFTVDYRFAALAKRIGLNGGNIHGWRW